MRSTQLEYVRVYACQAYCIIAIIPTDFLFDWSTRRIN